LVGTIFLSTIAHVNILTIYKNLNLSFILLVVPQFYNKGGGKARITKTILVRICLIEYKTVVEALEIADVQSVPHICQICVMARIMYPAKRRAIVY
jgi:hypothetical protein